MYRYVFGPVNSRRFGISLGLDLLGEKICSFNCVYCEVEKTQVLTKKRKVYVTAKDIIRELYLFFKTNPSAQLDYITLSGKGEPTLNKEIKKIIRHIKRYYTVPVCVLTNASLLHQEEVRKDILDADLIVPSLDAISKKIYKKVNLPAKSIKIDKIIEGIKKLKAEFKGKIYLEILLVKNINDNEKEINKLKTLAKELSPDAVYINTIHRPPSFSGYEPIDETRQEHLQNEFDLLLGKSPKLPSQEKEKNTLWRKDDIIDKLNSLLEIRPCTMEDLSKVFCPDTPSREELEIIINCLTQENILSKREYNSSIFYSLNKEKQQ